MKEVTKHYVYMLLCKDKTLYTGYTTDFNKRVLIHNKGKGAKYTKSRLPVILIYLEELSDKSSAMKREYEIKQFSRSDKIRLIGYKID